MPRGSLCSLRSEYYLQIYPAGDIPDSSTNPLNTWHDIQGMKINYAIYLLGERSCVWGAVTLLMGLPLLIRDFSSNWPELGRECDELSDNYHQPLLSRRPLISSSSNLNRIRKPPSADLFVYKFRFWIVFQTSRALALRVSSVQVAGNATYRNLIIQQI